MTFVCLNILFEFFQFIVTNLNPPSYKEMVGDAYPTWLAFIF